MPPLYIVQQNTKLRINNRRVQVEKDDPEAAHRIRQEIPSEVLSSTPLTQVDQVVIFGNASLTTPAIDALLAQNAEVVFLTQRGEFRGRLVGEVTPHVPLRRAQYRRLDDAEFVLETAKGFVSAKLHHQKALLQRHNKERQDAEIATVVEQIRQGIENVPSKTLVSSLLGVEGSATAAYFRGLRRLFDPCWKFDDRNRRPPRDPVNVLLSFGYTLFGQLTASAVQAVGLDPYAGFLHEVAYNRPALGLDLLEEFRPVVDGIVLWCCNSGQLTLKDFTPGPPERPIILGEAGQKRFIQAYEQRLEVKFTHPVRELQFPLRQCVLEQARQIANRVQNGPAGYQGMGFR